jgi:hypothetical protein
MEKIAWEEKFNVTEEDLITITNKMLENATD